MRQHARKLSLFVRRRIRVRCQLSSMHRCESLYTIDFYEISTDIENCVSLFPDDNECLRIPAPCRGISQCVNTPGSFECQCPEGYKLGLTARECVGKSSCRVGRYQSRAKGEGGGQNLYIFEGWQNFFNIYV